MLKKIPFGGRLYLAALVLRLIPVLLSFNLSIGLDDMFQYDMLARSLAAGDGFRWYGQQDLELIERYFPLDFIRPGDYDPRGVLTSFRAPGYPVFLALVYRLFGAGARRFFWARLVQAFLGAALAPLTYALVRRVLPQNERAARLAGAALAAYPMLVLYPLGLATENTFIPLFMAATLALLWAAETGGWRRIALAGLLFGLTMLTRSVVALALPLAGLWLWRQCGFRAAALLALVTTLVIAPWVARNSLLYGKFTFIETSSGYNLHMGYHPQAIGTFRYGPSLELMPYLDDAERDARGTEMAAEFIRAQPERFWPLAALRLGHFFGLERRVLTYFYSNNFFGPLPLPALVGLFLLFTLPFAVLATFAALGLALIGWPPPRFLVAGLALAYLLPHVFLLAEPRFHLAIVPLLALFAAEGWTRRRELLLPAARPRLALAVVLIALLAFNWGHELHRDRARLAAIFAPDGNTAYLDY